MWSVWQCERKNTFDRKFSMVKRSIEIWSISSKKPKNVLIFHMEQLRRRAQIFFSIEHKTVDISTFIQNVFVYFRVECQLKWFFSLGVDFFVQQRALSTLHALVNAYIHIYGNWVRKWIQIVFVICHKIQTKCFSCSSHVQWIYLNA